MTSTFSSFRVSSTNYYIILEWCGAHVEITKLVFGGIHSERGGIADKMAFSADKASSYADKSMIYADKPSSIADKIKQT